MKKLIHLPSIIIIIFFMTAFLQAQKATEVFIPIGKSPGLSGKYTVTGTIDSVKTDKHLMYMQDKDGNTYKVQVGDATKIFLDKSNLDKSNQTGTFEDCRPGAFCEVLFQDHDQKKGTAEWIKIRIEVADIE